MVFNKALKHHNNSNSFQYKPERGLSLDVFFCLQVDGLISKGGLGLWGGGGGGGGGGL